MAICRFGPKCDVFLSNADDGRIECIACSLNDRETHRALDNKAMIEHLEEHVAAGHKVPAEVFEALNPQPTAKRIVY